MSKLKIGSLFAGIGGIDLAFAQAGFEIVWANEIDKDACKTYQHNFPDTILSEYDIRKIKASSIPDFNILTTGFPCQSFSVCGNKKGFDVGVGSSRPYFVGNNGPFFAGKLGANQ